MMLTVVLGVKLEPDTVTLVIFGGPLLGAMKMLGGMGVGGVVGVIQSGGQTA